MASLDRDLFDQLKVADQEENWALCRLLAEKHLAKFPNHGPTLVTYARALITFAQYEKAGEVLDLAETVVEAEAMMYVHSMRGTLLDEQGRHAEAERSFMKAHELDPQDSAFLIFAAGCAYQSGALDRSEALARKAVACNDDFLDEACFNLAGTLLSQGRYEEAREFYVKALEIDPEYDIAAKRLEDVDLVLAALKQG